MAKIKKEDRFLEKNTRELIERNRTGSSVVTADGIEIINDLRSIDSTKALSANQGRILNEKINNLSSINVVKNW